jgi:sensor histidine kinase YesM
MGDRLRYTIDIPEALRNISLPPMLIQPLVENALRHGLEPRIEGGDILVSAEDKTGGYRLVVADTGVGMSEACLAGVGLTNVRERLENLYHGKAHLILEENQPTGLMVILEIPHD